MASRSDCVTRAVRPGGRPAPLAALLVLLVLLLAAAVPFAAPVAAQDDLACTDCHEIDGDQFEASVHAFLDCVDCHPAAAEVPHPEEEIAAASCDLCHDQAVSEFEESVHGQLALDGEPWVQGCLHCHGGAHELLPAADPASPVHPASLPATCGGCHADPAMAERFRLRLVQPVESYLASVHARALAETGDGASCSSCHGSHSIFRAADPRSAVYKPRVPETCGDCHGEIAAAFLGSIHGQALEAGVMEAPSCTDCHGEHRILSPLEKGSAVFASNIPKLACGSCHGDVRLAEKFGLDAGKVPAYEDSFHGLASRAGALTVAHCGSCHGIHDILPSTDPQSHIHPDNLPQTCGQCHPGAGSSFPIGEVHVVAGEAGEHPAVYWVREIYLWLIYLTIGGMVLHNLLDFRRKVQDPPRRPRAVPAGARQRMSKGLRLAHGLLASSFIILAYTGFALTYPEAWWASPLLAWEESFGLRGGIHRAAAVVMLLTALYHLAQIVLRPDVRACVAAMRPGKADLVEIKERLLYNLGRRDKPPHTPWVGYPEKMEYLAVVWGTAVMALTGFALWFENFTLHYFPKWVTDLATTIHFYEAVLACLAILVWHFYLVIFDPVVYPMDPAWLTGDSAPGRVVEREGEERG